MAAVLRSSGKTLQFFVCFICFFVFYVLDVVSITVYDRDTLFEHWSSVTQRNRTLSFWMPVDCSQTRHLSPLCGLRNRHAAADAEKEEIRAGVLVRLRRRASELLFQPFYWPTFSHWITNSVNCVRASHTNEKQGTAVLFASQKPGCLLWFQTQPSSSRASPCTARIEQRSSQGKAEEGVFVSISTTHGVMKGTYTLLNPSAPLIWNFIRFCVDRSGYRGNLQRS